MIRRAPPTARLLLGMLVVLVTGNAGALVAACSSSAPDPEDVADATSERASATDAPTGSDGRVPLDAAREGGHCTVVMGPCDLVLQDCPVDDAGAKQECVTSGTTSTMCVPLQASQQRPAGRECCSNNAAGNPCLPGLTCVGNPCEDGGPITGRCSPACCTGDDQACGKSDPEGISGACDLTLVDHDTNAPLHQVCTYRQRCKPFQQEPCKAGETCLVEDKVGTASCLNSFGKLNREPCSFANDCADGHVCAGFGDASVCHVICLLPNTVSPFDAAIEEAGSGKGGCPKTESCRITFGNDSPSWFGACGYPDGG